MGGGACHVSTVECHKGGREDCHRGRRGQIGGVKERRRTKDESRSGGGGGGGGSRRCRGFAEMRSEFIEMVGQDGGGVDH